ncbi:alpha/beta hydrolase fold domain-containing protein [Pyruvatibacter mobilis]|uniref:Alpha/beta hydrolase fold domain-containing protein n=1 Tax=Pyruvatibacter mobilis TaxID=1712261 RepID=A0A845Q7F3_9HYPH|nr:alpha/beta hydrolase [Pyruvatibacter mobilis]NBG94542.1 alpha/beta hydrolase fold domain-containing protein [Pyruvatibacter mobilis]QJD74059.1 alpha/beta hydrolase [Pyruvatibacter mobilis]GGD03813.1 acetylhydrolase [Pyruvatibacter mobilis]
MSLDPQIEALLAQLAENPAPKIQDLSPADARATYLAMASVLEMPDVPIGKTEDISIPGPAGDIPARIYRPVAGGGAALPCLVFFHGGGFVIGDLDTHDVLCRTLANEAGVCVVAVDYRLAPEHRYPAAAEDCYAATKWVEQNPDTLNIDPNAIAVAGDSAGGNLAAVVSLMARDNKGPQISFQLLMYPVTDMTGSEKWASRNEFAEGYFLEKETMAWFEANYFGENTAGRSEATGSPLLAPNLANLPPAYVVTAGFDPLRDEGKAFADALKAAGNDVEYIDYPGMIHGFFNMQGVLDVSREAVKTAARKLRDALAG